MFPPQSFQTVDIGVVLFLVLIEALLSADNALVLALMVRHLDKADQKKALFYGLGGAFLYRFVAILMARAALMLWWLQGLGALYLVWVALKHFRTKLPGGEPLEIKPRPLWHTVIAVETANMAFAIDSLLAGVAMIRSASKIWVVFAGAAIGIVLLRFAANVFIKIMAKYPMLDDVAYTLVGWVGVKLVFATFRTFGMGHPASLAARIPEMPDLIFWTVLLGITAIGSTLAVRRDRLMTELAGSPEIGIDL